MNIAFFGDSITQGDLGDSYVDLLQQQLPDHQLLNYGKNGDTIKSLYARIQRLKLPNRFDISFVWIGCNDIFVHVSKLFAVAKMITMQPWIRTMEEAERTYRDLLAFVSKKATHVFTVPPILIGEDTTNQYNQQLKQVSTMMQSISKNIENVTFIDLQKIFWKELETSTSSSYIPTAISGFVFDGLRCHSADDVNRCSKERGLQLTLDGVHLNSRGSQLATDTFYQYIIEKTDKNPK